jgi:hypothetical protein
MENRPMAISIRDQATREAMQSATGQTVVYDESGRLLGFFTPRVMTNEECVERELTSEELYARENDPNAVWHTPEEVMARLESLEKTM